MIAGGYAGPPNQRNQVAAGPRRPQAHTRGRLSWAERPVPGSRVGRDAKAEAVSVEAAPRGDWGLCEGRVQTGVRLGSEGAGRSVRRNRDPHPHLGARGYRRRRHRAFDRGQTSSIRTPQARIRTSLAPVRKAKQTIRSTRIASTSTGCVVNNRSRTFNGEPPPGGAGQQEPSPGGPKPRSRPRPSLRS